MVMMMELYSPESLILFSTLLFIILLYLQHHFTTKKRTTGFNTYPLVGSIPDFIINRHRFLEWTTAILRDCPTHTAVFFRPGKICGIMTANPDNLEHMLKSNFPNYPKGQRFISHLQDLLGQGIFNSDGALWKLQRRIASHEFNTKSLRNFVIQNVTVEIQTRLIPTLQIASEKQTVIDLQDVLERFAFDNVCKLSFNVDPACLGGGNGANSASAAGDSFMRAFEEAATLISGRFMSVFPWVWRFKRFLNVGKERKLRESISTVHAFADEIIRSRMETKGCAGDDADLLSRFIAVAEDNSPGFLRDIVISFILAGRDSTSSALSWFFWILSSRHDVKEKIVKEIKEVREKRVCKEGMFGYEELKEMNYLQAAILEAMRLYPPVAVDEKSCLNDDVLPDGTAIKKGWYISYNTYAMGRMESIWGKDCTEFKPERWLEEDGVYRVESPFRFPVFHAGPRMCLGKDMAYIQMKSIAASVIERFQIDAVDKDTCPHYVLSLTLRMKGGLPVRVTESVISAPAN